MSAPNRNAILEATGRQPRAARLSRALSDPVGAMLKILNVIGLQALVPASHASPEMLLRRYASRCRALGLDQLVVLLSFDCDTPEDAAAAQELKPWLDRLGMPFTLAVPGVELEHHADIYRRLAADDVPFLNHGYRAHAEVEGDAFVPATFYHLMTPEEVEADIRAGDAAVRSVTGRAPCGFRAPHFGYYQAPEQRALVYRIARDLGYRLCSDTPPRLGLRRGPVVPVDGGVLEIPLSGSLANPASILDSWGNLEPDRWPPVLRDAYADRFRDTVDFFLDNGLPGVINHYVDPWHVAGQSPFVSAIEHLARRGVPALTYDQLIDRVA